MRHPRRNHTATFKAKVALAALKGDLSLAELSQRFDVHPNKVTQWKSQSLELAEQVSALYVKTLHAMIWTAGARD